jgi:hypothetical protein
MKLLLIAVLQQVTEKDFRLLIDGKQYNDSVNSISLADLLKMQRVTVNYSWIMVRSIVVYCDFVKQEDRNHVYDGLVEILCTDNSISKEAKEKIKTMKPGHTVVISADDAVNKQGIKVYLKPIAFRIK